MLAGASVVLALIGLYFVVRIWMKWKDMDTDVLKARAFLNKEFLVKNWRYVFLSGASLTSHQVIKFLFASNYIESNLFIQLSYVLEFMSVLFLVILAYEWFLLLYAKS